MLNWHYKQYIASIYVSNSVATRAFDLPANTLYNRD